jgi:hypothetical protein
MQDPDGARYAEAYVEFKAAYAASPSWKILGNLGIAAMKLERDGEAIEAFEKYLKEGGEELDPDERAQIERDLKTMQSNLVTVTVQSAPDGATIIDERVPVTGNTVSNRYGPLSGSLTFGIRAGHHRVRAELKGYEPSVWEFDGKGATQENHSYKLEVAKAAAAGGSTTIVHTEGVSGLRIASYAAIGVGVVGIGAGTLFGIQSKNKSDEADNLCGGDRSSCHLTEGSADANQVVTLNDDAGSAHTFSVVGFVVGGVGLAAGVTMFILSSGGSKSESKTTASVTPWVGYRSLGVSGRF